LLERGTVDAVGFPNYAFAALKVSDISKWFTSNMSLGTVFCPTIVGLKAYNKLSKEYQDILMNARFVAYDVSRARFATNDKKVVPQFRKAMQEIRYDDATMADFRKIAAKPVWDDWVKEATAKGVPAQELLDLILATAKKASN
jgi:TRAP-type C4-dicarboxylate transport system substrate-binding protein